MIYLSQHKKLYNFKMASNTLESSYKELKEEYNQFFKSLFGLALTYSKIYFALCSTYEKLKDNEVLQSIYLPKETYETLKTNLELKLNHLMETNILDDSDNEISEGQKAVDDLTDYLFKVIRKLDTIYSALQLRVQSV